MTQREDIDEQKLRDRVQKLLALATSSNPHEAALAAGKAAALIAQYRIDHADILDEQADRTRIQIFRDEPLDASKRLRAWKIALASAVARVWDCRIVVSGPRSGERHGRKDNIRRIWIVGRPEDAQRLRWMYPTMVSLVQMVSRAKLEKASHRFREDFRRGLVSSLHTQMQRMREQTFEQGALAGVSKDPAADPKSALVPAPHRADRRGLRVERWMEEHLGMHLGEGKQISVILAAYRAGQEAGAELSEQLVEMVAGGGKAPGSS